MPDGPTLVLFVVSCFMLSLLPGPAMLLILSRATRHGWRCGVVVMLGTTAGLAIHIVAVILGLSQIILNSTQAFQVVKWIGVAYLIYLGLKMILAGKHTELTSGLDGQTSVSDVAPATGKLFRQGFLTNATNPKAALFFLALFPQFIPPNSTQPALVMVMLGAIVMAVDMLCYSTISVGASLLAARLKSRPKLIDLQQRAFGAILMFFAGKLSSAESPSG